MTRGCTECRLCNVNVTCQAYECLDVNSAGTNAETAAHTCELWFHSPSNFMTFSCSGNYRCRIRDSFISSSNADPAYNYSYGTSSHWDTTNSNCEE